MQVKNYLFLFFEEPTHKVLSGALFYGWKKGLKTGSYYIRTRLKSKAQQFTLDPEKFNAVKNFLVYVDEGFFNDTIFHRVIPNFMIQAGGITSNMQQKPSHPPIKNEADNGLQNKRGTIAMGQKPGNPDSASSHFFINLVDNPHLDYHGSAQPGYTVFGKVIEGMDTVDKIAAAKTTTDKPVIITSAKRANP